MANRAGVPTFPEAGVPGYVVDSWTGMFVTAGTPRAIIDRLHAEVVKAGRDAGYRQAMAAIGVEAVSSSPEEFGVCVRTETGKWRRAVRIWINL